MVSHIRIPNFLQEVSRLDEGISTEMKIVLSGGVTESKSKQGGRQ